MKELHRLGGTATTQQLAIAVAPAEVFSAGVSARTLGLVTVSGPKKTLRYTITERGNLWCDGKIEVLRSSGPGSRNIICATWLKAYPGVHRMTERRCPHCALAKENLP